MLALNVFTNVRRMDMLEMIVETHVLEDKPSLVLKLKCQIVDHLALNAVLRSFDKLFCPDQSHSFEI